MLSILSGPEKQISGCPRSVKKICPRREGIEIKANNEDPWCEKWKGDSISTKFLLQLGEIGLRTDLANIFSATRGPQLNV